MNISSAHKNALLILITVCIFGALSGFYMHKNDIRLSPYIQKTLHYPVSVISATTILPTDILQIQNVTISRRVRYTPDVTGIDLHAKFEQMRHNLSSIINTLRTIPGKMHKLAFQGMASVTGYITESFTETADFIQNTGVSIYDGINSTYSTITESIKGFYTKTHNAILHYHRSCVSGWEKMVYAISELPGAMLTLYPASTDFEFKNILSYEPAAGAEQPEKTSEIFVDNTAEEVTANPDAEETEFKYDMEDQTLEIEGVLVPQNTTVISSSRDGKIAKIHFENGDMFQKGDILIEYECDDVKAEMEAAEAEKQLTQKRTMRNEKLLKLDIISDIEHLGFKTEDIKATAQARIVEERIEQCNIRAAYDGRVTNKLANDHEYTRTDRVLMEVASLDDLEVEFLIPSLWLRWVNVDAPVSIMINETGEKYEAIVKRIYGEIDPVSQSIQMTAKLQPYTSPLLPGMSGTITLDVARIRDTGIKGFLEQPRYARSDDGTP